jgi:tetratricopeptide (TPR) repeat protein
MIAWQSNPQWKTSPSTDELPPRGWCRDAAAACLGLGFLLLLVSPVPALAPMSEEATSELQAGIDDFQARRYDSALKHFQKAIERAQTFQPKAADYLNEARREIRAKHPKEAEEAINQAQALDPKSEEVYYVRAYLARRTSRPGTALEALDKALELKPDYEEALDELWKLLEEERRFALAVRKFQELSKKPPENLWALYYLGRAHLASGNYEQAEVALAEVVRLRPDNFGFHESYVETLQKLAKTVSPIQRYEELVKKFPQPIVKLWLAQLYIEGDQTREAVKLLQEIGQSEAVLDDVALRLALAKRFEDAGDKAARLKAAESKLSEPKASEPKPSEYYAQAAEQFSRALGLLADPKTHSEHKRRLKATFEYGRVLVKAGRVEVGIRKLNEAMLLYRQVEGDRPLPVLFHLGKAHRLAGHKNKAEEYFREFLRGLEEKALGVDPESAEELGDIYLEDEDFRKAAEVLDRAVQEALAQQLPNAVRLQYKLARALYGQGSYERCIDKARAIIRTDEYGPQARLLLAEAYLADGQPDKAIDELRQLENLLDANKPPLDEKKKADLLKQVSAIVGRALLARGRAAEALPYIEKAYQQTQGRDEKLSLLYAQVLDVLDRTEEARGLYQGVLDKNPRSAEAWIGMGELEMHVAEGLEGSHRADHLRQSVANYKKALDLKKSDPGVLVRLGQAERELTKTQSALDAQGEHVRLVLYTSGLILAALVPLALAGWIGWRSYRTRWAERCFKEVLALEHDVKHLIRNRARHLWQDAWQDRLLEECRERVNGKYLKSKLAEDRAKGGQREDVLGVCNFGHLVGMLDAGWDAFGMEQLATRGTRKLIVASLSYVGDCRNAIAHGQVLEELQQDDSRRTRERPLQHMNLQILSSIRVVRQNLNLTAATAAADDLSALPMLQPADSVVAAFPAPPAGPKPGR